MSAIPDTFQEHVLNAADVCNECFGIIREEHEIVPVSERKRNRTYPVQHYTRYKRRTTVEHVPGKNPTQDHATFCECGNSSAFDRHRSEIVGPARFRELLKTAIETVESKGVTLSREHAIKRAFELGLATKSRFPLLSADQAIAEGIEFGVTMSTVSATPHTTPSQAALATATTPPLPMTSERA